MVRINLNNLPLYSGAEASIIWGKERQYVKTILKNSPERFPEGTVRKIGGTWIVTAEGMEAVTGKKLEEVQMIKELEKLIGRQMTAADLDEKVAQITGRRQAFDAISWAEAKEQGSLAYEEREGEVDGAYNVRFEVVEDGVSERSAVVRVVDVEEL